MITNNIYDKDEHDWALFKLDKTIVWILSQCFSRCIAPNHEAKVLTALPQQWPNVTEPFSLFNYRNASV